MEDARYLVAAIVASDDPAERYRRFRKAIDSGVAPDDFKQEDLQRAFQYIIDHTNRYGAPPSYNVLRLDADVDLPKQRVVMADSFEWFLDSYIRQKQLTYALEFADALTIAGNAGDPEKLRDCLAAYLDGLRKLLKRQDTAYLLGGIEAAVEEHNRLQFGFAEKGIEIGFPYVDAVTGGIQKGDIALIAGASGSGKTYILCRAAEHAARTGKRVLFISMEMTTTQIARRVAALGAHIDAMAFRLGRLSRFAMEKVNEYIEAIKSRDPDHFVVVEGGMSLKIADIALLVKEYKPDFLVVDGAYMLKPSVLTGLTKRWEQVMEAIEELKVLAVRERIAVLASVQFKRKGAKEGLEGIGYSYALAQVASLAFSITDPDDGMSSSLQADDEKEGIKFKCLEIIKGREGESGKLLLRYDTYRTKIEQWEVVEGPHIMYDDSSEIHPGDDFDA